MAIQFKIYTCAPIPTAFNTPENSPDAGLFSPLSCTLIYTPTTALLVDCPASIAATKELVPWIQSELPAGCRLEYFVASHAHGDHFFGFPVLENSFPGIKATATLAVVEGIEQQYSPQIYEGLWTRMFPPAEAGTGLPEMKAEFLPLNSSNEIDLDGHLVQVHDVPHGDTAANSFVHVPELGLVVAGDIVYDGDCHQYLGEACTQPKRDAWLKSLSQIAALNPQIIVPGHTFTPQTEPNMELAMSMLETTKGYMKAFEEELKKAESPGQLFENMKARFHRWNLWILDGSCQASFAAKQS